MVPTSSFVNSIPLTNAAGKPIIVVKPKKKRKTAKRRVKRVLSPAVKAIQAFQERERRDRVKNSDTEAPKWREMV